MLLMYRIPGYHSPHEGFAGVRIRIHIRMHGLAGGVTWYVRERSWLKIIGKSEANWRSYQVRLCTVLCKPLIAG